VLGYLKPYLAQLPWSAPPLLLLAVFPRYLEAMDVVTPITIAVLTAIERHRSGSAP